MTVRIVCQVVTFMVASWIAGQILLVAYDAGFRSIGFVPAIVRAILETRQ